MRRRWDWHAWRDGEMSWAGQRSVWPGVEHGTGADERQRRVSCDTLSEVDVHGSMLSVCPRHLLPVDVESLCGPRNLQVTSVQPFAAAYISIRHFSCKHKTSTDTTPNTKHRPTAPNDTPSFSLVTSTTTIPTAPDTWHLYRSTTECVLRPRTEYVQYYYVCTVQYTPADCLVFG